MSGTKELGPDLLPFARPSTGKPEPAGATPDEGAGQDAAIPAAAPGRQAEGRLQLDTWKRPVSDGASRFGAYDGSASDAVRRPEPQGRLAPAAPRPPAPVWRPVPGSPTLSVNGRAISTLFGGPNPAADGSIRIPVEIKRDGKTLFVLVRLDRELQQRLGYRPSQPPEPVAPRDLAGPKSNLELPPPGTQRVREQAEALWSEKPRDGAAATRSVRQIVEDLRDVNNRGGIASAAAAQVMADLNLEKAEVAKLPRDRQLQYQALVDATRHDPSARLALQVLLDDGTLTAGPHSASGEDLLGELAAVAAGRVAGGLSATELLSNVLQDVATPGAISQRNRATCAAATLQILTAKKDPAEYVRIVRGLAAPEGSVALRDGSTLRRLSGTETEDGTARSASSRLWQPAVMDFAAGGRGSYSNYQDRFIDTGRRGLASDAVSRALDALEATTSERLETHSASPAERERQFAKVLVNANSGNPVPVAIKWGDADPASGRIDSLHEVLVNRADKDRVYYTNPWGTEESLTRDEFKARLHWVHLPT